MRSLIFHYSPTTVLVIATVNSMLVARRSIAHHTTSQQLIPCIQDLLQAVEWNLDSVNYLACAQGPGSFTTIRSLIVTSNALAFSTGLPLIGYNALAFLAEAAHQAAYAATYALADAFSGTVQSVRYPQAFDSEACPSCSYELFFQNIAQELTADPTQRIQIVGAGLQPRTYKLILLEHKNLVYHPDITYADPVFVAQKLHQQWTAHPQGVSQLLPLYSPTSA